MTGLSYFRRPNSILCSLYHIFFVHSPNGGQQSDQQFSIRRNIYLSWCEENFILISSKGLSTEASAELCAISLHSIFKAVAVIAACPHVKGTETCGYLGRYTCIRCLYMSFFCYFLTLPKAVPHFEKKNHLCWRQHMHSVSTNSTLVTIFLPHYGPRACSPEFFLFHHRVQVSSFTFFFFSIKMPIPRGCLTF